MANFFVTACLLNGLLMLLTIMGNVLVLTAMLTTPSLRSPSTIFLCGLAVSDLLVGFVVKPIYIGFGLNPGPELEHLAYILVSLACSFSLYDDGHQRGSVYGSSFSLTIPGYDDQ